MPLSDDRERQVREYRTYIDGLGVVGRQDFVDAARRNEDWPDRAYLIGHALKWGLGRRADEYAQLAYETKNRSGVRVYAYVHPVQGNRGLAFVDMEEESVVQFDCDKNLNFDCFRPSQGTRPWIADKEASGWLWRLKDTER